MKIKIGTKFSGYYADGRTIWQVVEKKGKDCWLCAICRKEDKGVTKLFSSNEIFKGLEQDRANREYRKNQETFYANLSPGTIVHYHHGFGMFVRCLVDDEHNLVPIGLVGPWPDYELPHYNKDGTVNYPYFANKIKNKQSFHPYYAYIYEAGLLVNHADVDPTKLPEISLDLPLLTPEQQEIANCWKKVYDIKKLIEDCNENNDDPHKLLKSITTLLALKNI